MDYDEYTTSRTFTSELGQELLKLRTQTEDMSLNPPIIKDIIGTSEDTRIATRLSELSYQIINQHYLTQQSRQIRDLRLDLKSGQQCVRDFFICLNENLVSWPDVYSTFAFSLTHITECSTCKHKNESETTQLYLEMPVPNNESNLKESVENFLTERSNFSYKQKRNGHH